VAVIAVETHGGIVVVGRNNNGEAIAPEDAFNGVLPFLVGNIEHGAEEDDFFTGEAEFGAQ
jgi:hypothetical protein